MKIEHLEKIPELDNKSAFSLATRCGDFLFISGQASIGPDGSIIEDDFEGEMRRSISNLSSILSHYGMSLSDIAHVRCYLQSAKYAEEYNVLYREIFARPYPARTTISDCLGEAIKFEIDCVAYLRREHTVPSSGIQS